MGTEKVFDKGLIEANAAHFCVDIHPLEFELGDKLRDVVAKTKWLKFFCSVKFLVNVNIHIYLINLLNKNKTTTPSSTTLPLAPFFHMYDLLCNRIHQ